MYDAAHLFGLLGRSFLRSANWAPIFFESLFPKMIINFVFIVLPKVLVLLIVLQLARWTIIGLIGIQRLAPAVETTALPSSIWIQWVLLEAYHLRIDFLLLSIDLKIFKDFVSIILDGFIITFDTFDNLILQGLKLFLIQDLATIWVLFLFVWLVDRHDGRDVRTGINAVTPAEIARRHAALFPD